jgi:predicted  nucleic acid-binding Zn-ribbon protein
VSGSPSHGKLANQDHRPSSESVRVSELKNEILDLQNDLAATILRQRESGASATEAMHQLEKEANDLRKQLEKGQVENAKLVSEVKTLESQLAKLEQSLSDTKGQWEQGKLKGAQLEIERDRDV